MSGKASLIGLGMSTIDVLVSSEALPRWEGCAPLDHLSLDGGGMAANTLVAFSKLGGRAGFVGACGNDALADLKVEFTGESRSGHLRDGAVGGR